MNKYKYILPLLGLLLSCPILIGRQSINCCNNNDVSSPFYYRTPLDRVLRVAGAANGLSLPFNEVGANQQSPDEPFSISLSAMGPYRAPANIELVASITHPISTTISKVEFYANDGLLTSIEHPPL